MISIAVDVGSGLTKAIDNKGNKFECQSLAGNYTNSEFEFGINKKDIVTLKSGQMVVGNGAKLNVKPENLRNTLTKNWNNDDGYKALMFRAIADLLPEGYKGEISLATGAPMRTFKKSKAELQKWLCGHHRFKCGNTEYNIVIHPGDLFLVPQVAGLFFADLDFTKEISTGLKAYFDFGTHTSGFAVFEGGNFLEWSAGGKEIGGGLLAKALGDWIEEAYGVKLDKVDTVAAMNEQEIVISGQRIDLTNAINSLAITVMMPLWEDSDGYKAKWENKNIQHVVVGGGYGKQFAGALKTQFHYAEPATGLAAGKFGVVNGYMNFLKLKLNAKQPA